MTLTLYINKNYIKYTIGILNTPPDVHCHIITHIPP